MARKNVSVDNWGLLLTTTKDTLVGVEGGNARFLTSVPAGENYEDGYPVRNGDGLIFPAGLSVYGNTKTPGVSITYIDFGV